MSSINKLSIASETVLYAAECLRSGERELAMHAIRDETSLAQEQRQAIEKIIRDLGAARLAPKDLNLAEARMIGILKPKVNEPMFKRMNRLSKLASYADQKTLCLKDVLNRKTFPEIEIETVGFGPEYWVKFFEYFPELENLKLDIEGPQDYSLQPIASGIKASCPKFERLEFNYKAYKATELISHFADSVKTLVWNPNDLQWSHFGLCKREQLNAWAKFPHLKELVLIQLINPMVYDSPEIFDQFSHLEKLTVTIKSDPNDTLLRGNNADPELAALARIPNLQVIDVRNSRLSYDGVRQFVASKRQFEFVASKKTTLKQMMLSLSGELHLDQVIQLRHEFPSIIFITTEEKK